MSANPTPRDWRRSEPKTVRPFSSAREAGQALAECALKLKSDDSFSSHESIRISAAEIGRLEPVLRVALDRSALQSLTRDEMSALKCVVTLESRFIKRTEVIEEVRIDDLRDSLDVEVPIDLSRQLRVGYSTAISAALCLAQEKDPSPGRLFHKGHWLAKKTFELSVEREGIAFSIQPLDDVVRARFGLPTGTLYYIHYVGGLNEALDSESPPARVYVAKEVIDKLSLSTQQRSAAIVESILAAEITAFLVVRGLRDMGDEEEVTPNSPLASLLRRLKENTGLDADAIRRYAKDNDGLALRAYLHSDCQTIRNILAG